MRKHIKRLLMAVVVLTTTAYVEAADSVSLLQKVQPYLPTVGICFRGRFEQDTERGAGRFEVRNARLRLSGTVIPQIGYYYQMDLCDQGVIKILDAYATVMPGRGWKLMLGQSRVPISVDASRGPGGYLFANRSFLGRYMLNQRSVGLKAGYTCPGLPLYAEAGVFNSAPMAVHNLWFKHYTIGAKARYKFWNRLTLEGGFKSDVPTGGPRTDFSDVTLSWQTANWLFEGEYVVQHYHHNAYRNCHAWNTMVQFQRPVGWGIFNNWSVQGRYDGMTDHSTGTPDSEGRLITNQSGRTRVTVGSTVSRRMGKAHVDFQLEYEQYFYAHGVKADPGAGNKLVAEMVIYF